MFRAWRDAVNQSCTAARILPRWAVADDGRLCPVISRMIRSPEASATSIERSIAAQAWSRFIPCRSRVRSGRTDPLASLRSQVPSRLDPISGRSGASGTTGRGGGTLPRTFAGWGGGATGTSAVVAGAAFRDNGRMVSATLAHSAASSGLSERTRNCALGKQQQRLTGRRHSARSLHRIFACAPESVDPVGALDRPARILRNPQAACLGPIK